MNSEKNEEILNLEIQNQNEYQLHALSKEQSLVNNEICIFNIKNSSSGKKEKHSGNFDRITSSYNENQINYNPSLSISQNSS